jgi:hypothetical protein
VDGPGYWNYWDVWDVDERTGKVRCLGLVGRDPAGHLIRSIISSITFL